MSIRFVELVSARAALRAGIVAAAAIVMAACGASAPRQAATTVPAAVAPAAERSAGAPPAAVSPPESRRGSRRDQREPAPVDAAAAALEPIPEGAQQAYNRALAALHAQDWLQAELELEQLVHDYPSYPGPQVNLAIVYAHDGRRDDARAALDRALAIAPGNAAANNQLGILLRNEGKFAEAERAYRRALETDPGYALAHYNLGVLLDVYLRRGADAIEQYEAYQGSLNEPDKTVAGWLIDLRRRVGNRRAHRRSRRRTARENDDNARYSAARRSGRTRAGPADDDVRRSEPVRRERAPLAAPEDLEPAVDVGGTRLAVAPRAAAPTVAPHRRRAPRPRSPRHRPWSRPRRPQPSRAPRRYRNRPRRRVLPAPDRADRAL